MSIGVERIHLPQTTALRSLVSQALFSHAAKVPEGTDYLAIEVLVRSDEPAEL